MRIYDEFLFWLERQLVRGAGYRLLVIAALIGLISLVGGGLALALGSGIDDLGAAVWWAFLRLSDPGYLGDDVGTVNRVVSTVLTVLGYVVFLGALVAVLTQWLNAHMERLEQGLTPVARDDHIIILGWTNRTEAVVRELMLCETRVRRMLRRRRRGGELHIVILARQVTAVLVQDLRDSLAEVWDERRITLRSGTALRVEHLERVDAAHAAAVIIPGVEFGTEADRADTSTIKALLSLGRFRSEDGRRPYVVAEVFRGRSVPLARQAYDGELEVVASDAVVSRLLARNVVGAGLSVVYDELLTHGHGNELYIRDLSERAGSTLEDIQALFPDAVVLGAVRPSDDGATPLLNPLPSFRLEAGDRLVVLAASEEAARPAAQPAVPVAARGAPTGDAADPAADPAAPGKPARHRVLILGWSHKIPALLREFQSYEGESFEVRIVSTVPEAERVAALRHVALHPGQVRLNHSEADPTIEAELAAARPAEYDSVVIVASDWLASIDESDARTLLAFLLLERLLPATASPAVIVELLDPDNVELLGRGRGEVIVSPLVVSHMLAQVALRRELRVVFEDLFAPGGTELSFLSLDRYAEPGEELTFEELAARAAGRGQVALGVRTGLRAPDLQLNPPRGSRWRAGAGVEVAALVSR